MEHDVPLTEDEIRLLISSLQKRREKLKGIFYRLRGKQKEDAEVTVNRCYHLQLKLHNFLKGVR